MHARQVIILALGCLGPVSLTRAADGQTESEPSRLDIPAAERVLLQQAKDQFRRGVALLNAGDTEGALEDFLRSRELLPSGRNTVNAAICLERLGRYDEAFELYEEVVARFSADLEPEDRDNLVPVMASLRGKIGYLELSANVDGEVIIGGRPRGRLPFRTALRVLPGRHTLRILKDGYRPFDATLNLAAGETRQLDARLELLGAPLAPPPGAMPFVSRRAREAAPEIRWTRRRWQLELSATVGAIYSARTRAGIESSCPDFCASDRGVLGGRVVLAVGLQHRSGFGIELAGGYAALRQKLSRGVFDGSVTYALDQTLTAEGVTGVLSGHLERPIGLGLTFASSAGIGLWFANFETRVSGSAWTTGPAEPLPNPTPGSASEMMPFVSLALELDHRMGRLALGLELGAWFLPGVGPGFRGPVLGTGPACGRSTQDALTCSSKALDGERAHGSFWLLTPELVGRCAF